MPLDDLLERNKSWAKRRRDADPAFFQRLAGQQAPSYFWIGCSDSRVPATQITDLNPGEIFVHRNVANLAVHTDLNFLSCLQFAVDVLEVEHIIVCGHYGCGGIKAALSDRSMGLLDHWLRNLRDLREQHADRLVGAPHEREDALVELNVVAQVDNVARNPIIQSAWRTRDTELTVSGWVYSLQDGILRDLGYNVRGNEQLHEVHRLKGAP